MPARGRPSEPWGARCIDLGAFGLHPLGRLEFIGRERVSKGVREWLVRGSLVMCGRDASGHFPVNILVTVRVGGSARKDRREGELEVVRVPQETKDGEWFM